MIEKGLMIMQKEKEEEAAAAAATKDMMISSISPTQLNHKSCSFCHTITTPLWRAGPSGPKSLCNACGIKYNRKRRALLGLDRGRKQEDLSGKKKRRGKGGKCNNRKVRESLKLRLVALEREMALVRSEKQRNKLGEEEWAAAILLMALSWGSAAYA